MTEPTWTCLECGAVDEFNVKHEEWAQENDRVITVISCNVCGFRCSDERSETRPKECSGCLKGLDNPDRHTCPESSIYFSTQSWWQK